jgi:hypothetical protein
VLNAIRRIALAASLLAAAPALAADEPSETAPREQEHTIRPELLQSGFYDAFALERFVPMTDAEMLYLARTEVADAEVELPGPRIPEPDDQRIRAKKRRFKTRYKMQERTLGVALQPAFAMLQGSVVGGAFDNGFAFTARFIAQVSPANQVFLDIGYSRHDMKNPRPMFFRTAVTENSGFSGQLEVWNPAIFFAFTFPVGAGPRSKPMFIPKTYVGMGPMYTQAKGRVTNSGSKGTVTGHGTQPFVQFTPGLGMDVRVLDFFFIGAEIRERITLPTKRPDQTAEFSIPKLYVFEAALNFSYMFY